MFWRGQVSKVEKLCPQFNNMVNSRGENDYFPKIPINWYVFRQKYPLPGHMSTVRLGRG